MKFPVYFNEIEIRPPKPSDAKSLMEYINELVEEKVYILKCNKATLKEEKEWLNKNLKEIKKNKTVFLVALKDKKVIAGTEISQKKEKAGHVGKFGISILKDFRGKGLGKKLIDLIIELAKEKLKGLELITLEVFVKNRPAVKLYRKFGFKRVAKLRKTIKFEGNYYDEYIMHRWL